MDRRSLLLGLFAAPLVSTAKKPEIVIGRISYKLASHPRTLSGSCTSWIDKDGRMWLRYDEPANPYLPEDYSVRLAS